ncbi:hypothetical protein N7471_007805 [Penicillium samsonianum]|uniref:uncharacterized protein n=1 Tax=Penicillium samsonianum TaxID=1882272 RepID=UPI002548BEEC|nr:uncharacterized protein N7471_007805 [Penicillium samsonianum]KAJ6132590.1 hypothetical protein N7471_007805 [Penicillium samsonianum]
MVYTNITTTMTVTTMITTTIFSTLVREPSVPPSSAPFAPSISKAVANLAKIPAGLWAVIFLVLAAAIAAGAYFLKKEGKKPEKDDEEEKKEEPKKAKETPTDDLTAAAANPQTALTTEWLRERREGKTRRPLPILVEATAPNVALPAADTSGEVIFVPVPPPPPAHVAPAPRGETRSTALRNTFHGTEKFLRPGGSPLAVAPA